MTELLFYLQPSIRDDLDELITLLENQSNSEYPHEYIISECFPKDEFDKPKIYRLTNLIMGYENGIVFSSDDKEEIYRDKSRVLNGFLIDSIVYIGFQTEKNIVTISLEDGYIRIKY